jgi:hypothetical protein
MNGYGTLVPPAKRPRGAVGVREREVRERDEHPQQRVVAAQMTLGDEQRPVEDRRDDVDEIVGEVNGR